MSDSSSRSSAFPVEERYECGPRKSRANPAITKAQKNSKENTSRHSQPSTRSRSVKNADADNKVLTTDASEAPTASEELVALYCLDDVSAALGISSSKIDNLQDGSFETEHQARLGAILAQGDKGRWRKAFGPVPAFEDDVARLSARAPHFGDLSRLVLTNLHAALNMSVPAFLGPVLLVGAPGTGKTWYLSQLGRILGLPFRSYSMSASTLGEGLQGAHPSWRNAAPGLVAKTLLREEAANPIIFIDEFDKVQAGGWNVDPYRPFYGLIDPSGSRGFVDEYLGFGIDASKVLWVMAANDCTGIPAAIMDRLTILQVPDMTFEQRLAVASSIYDEANIERRGFFEPIARVVAERLASLNPRSMRIVLGDAMARAAADRRRTIAEEDVRPRQRLASWRAGFR